MRRREFVKIIAGSAIGTLPLPSYAQQAAMPIVGFVNAASAESFKRQVAAFLEGLAQNGYIDGQNVKVEYRWAEGQYDQMPALISELLSRQVAVISVTGSTAAAQAAMAATSYQHQDGEIARSQRFCCAAHPGFQVPLAIKSSQIRHLVCTR